MATIDIGKLAFTHKGDYNGSTAYVARDVVYYNGSAYIAKTSTTGNLPTSTAHWSTFASGSGGIWNSGLSIGTAGQVVKVNSGASALEFGTISSDFVKTGYIEIGSDASSFDLQNCFTSDYDIYKVVFTARTTGATNARFRFYTGTNTEVTSNNYRYGQWLVTTNSSTNTNGNSSGYSETNFFPRENIDGNAVHSGNWDIMVYNPYDSAVKTYVSWQYAGFDGSYLRTAQGGGFYDNAESHTGLKFYVAAHNYRAGAQVGCYGFKK